MRGTLRWLTFSGDEMKHHRTDKCATDGNDTANNAGPDGEINSR
ncbi:hypothetical protein AB18_3548 [Escherichia coli 3-267-03_S1_C1]|nr:hypothetical protein AB76_3606 [Escherichia coli 3-267-03_S1_C3]KDU17949.1 hypothetical protein AB18_3548 [Escherichia coli 3-267-03_S1_C1]